MWFRSRRVGLKTVSTRSRPCVPYPQCADVLQVYAQNTLNEVLGWYGLCASSTASPSLSTSRPFNAAHTLVSSPSTIYRDDIDSRLTDADAPLDLTCSIATVSRLCSLLTVRCYSNLNDCKTEAAVASLIAFLFSPMTWHSL